MKITAKIDYACKAILELSLHWPNKSPLQVIFIAQTQQIPEKFLIQILLNLKNLGYVKSIRGKRGGYLLTKEPKDINLGRLTRDLGGGGYMLGKEPEKSKSQLMDVIWVEVDGVVQTTLEQLNFEVISNRQRKSSNIMMYDI